MTNSLSGKTAIVVGASRGLGRGVAETLGAAGAVVVSVARTAVGDEATEARDRIEIADAGAEGVAAELMQRYDPDIVVLVAGSTPTMLPLQDLTWETFSANWDADVRITFLWLQQILRRPMRAGGRVVTFSSGAAIGGSALSGGYAGAKATQRFITGYAQAEAARAGLRLTFTSLLPLFAPETQVGRAAVAAYAERAGIPIETFLESFSGTVGALVSPEIAGAAVLRLVTEEPSRVAAAYRLTGTGPERLP